MSLARAIPSGATGWSLLSGLLLATAFPRLDLAWMAWFALVPLFLVMTQRPFWCGFVAGIGFFAPVLYWLNIVMTTYGGLHPVFSLVAYLLLTVYLALFFGAATWASCRLLRKRALSPLLTLPVLWVALEYLRSFLLSGFPWASLGYSQQSLLPMIQSADLFGVYGLSFLIILVNAALALAMARVRSGQRLPWGALTAALLLVTLNYAYGSWRLASEPDQRAQSLTVGLVQGNIDQSVKWDPAYQQQTIDRYRELSRAASTAADVELLVWPESATPFYFQEHSPLSQLVREVPRESGASLIFGSPAYEREGEGYRFLNSAFLLSGAGEVMGRSDKIHLVPFGEYVPLGEFLPFIDKLVAGIGDFSPGELSPLPFGEARVGVLVCFEGIFPELARDYVRRGSDLLVNVTNDAWFGRSSAPYQHLAMVRFRAVENRIWVARAANTGISALIAPSGRIGAQTPIFEPRFLTAEAGLGAVPTLYTRSGDLFPALFLVLGLWWLLRSRTPLRRST